MKKKKGSRSLDQIAHTFSLFAPPKKFLAPAATAEMTEHLRRDDDNPSEDLRGNQPSAIILN